MGDVLQAMRGREDQRMASETNEDPGDALNDLAIVMADASICGLGQAAPNPLLCVLKFFPEDIR